MSDTSWLNDNRWYGVDCPCKGCTKRTLGCHSTCDDYINFHNELTNRKQKERLDNAHEVRVSSTWSYLRKEKK